MIRNFLHMAVLFNALGIIQTAFAMTDSARPRLGHRHRAAFLDNPMYKRLAESLDRKKSEYQDYTTVYLAIPKEFIFKNKALSEIKAYAQAHGVLLPFSVRNYIADAESYAGKPLRVEFHYMSLFDPNVAKPIVVPSVLFGSGRALTSDDFSVLKPYVPADMLREFVAFLKEYADRIGYAQYFPVQLSIPNDRVDSYVQSQAVGGDYYALLDVQRDDTLEHAGLFVVRLVKPDISLLSTKDKLHLDKQFEEWIKRIGAAAVSVAQEKKVPALLPRPHVPLPVSSVVPPAIDRGAKPVVKQSCKPVYSTPVVSSVPPRINRSSKPVGVPPINRASKPSILRPGIRPSSLLPRPVLEREQLIQQIRSGVPPRINRSSKPVGVPPINRASKPSVLRPGIRPSSLLPRPVAGSAAYSDSARLLGQIRAGMQLKSVPEASLRPVSEREQLIQQIRSGMQLKPVSVDDISSGVDQTERGAFLQQIQRGVPLKPAQTRVGFSGTPLAILNRAVRTGDLGDAQRLGSGIQGAASIEWNNEEDIRQVPRARSDFATFSTVPTGETTHKQEVIPLHANRMNPATEAALVAGLQHRRYMLREDDSGDEGDEGDWE